MTASNGPERRAADVWPMPSFRQPPVIEVVLAVSFEPLEGLGALQVNQLWADHFRSDFPKTEQQPPYMPPVERFGRRARLPDIKVEVLDSFPAPRYWFIDRTGTQVIQIQRDWFARNWRKREDHPEYNRYRSIREPFMEGLQTLSDFVQEAGFGSVKPVQCEVTYINHIEPSVWSEHGELSRIMKIWRDDAAREFLPRPEQAQFNVSYVIPVDSGPQGRLHVSMQPAFTVDNERPIYVLNLTARGAPLGDDISGVMNFLDVGHEWVVRSFADLTSEDMQAAWGRNDS